jgi:23S rRNA pseudouridine1911/1915/1917 synthase
VDPFSEKRIQADLPIPDEFMNLLISSNRSWLS